MKSSPAKRRLCPVCEVLKFDYGVLGCGQWMKQPKVNFGFRVPEEAAVSRF